jgi:hypothetical protein
MDEYAPVLIEFADAKDLPSSDLGPPERLRLGMPTILILTERLGGHLVSL